MASSSSFTNLPQERESAHRKTLRRIQVVEFFHDSRKQKPAECFHSARMTAGAYSLPKLNGDKPLGEDAFFISDNEQTIGVADGVGGCIGRGIDSGVYARQLMNNAAEFAQNHCSNGVDSMAVLSHAFENSKADGASTACVITLRDNALRAVNVGDSGFCVIRSGKIVYKSPVQLYRFNYPFQLAASGVTTPSGDGQEVTFEVERGDVVVAATDGLFDNLFGDEVEATVRWCLEAGALPERTALNLGKKARMLSFVRDKPSPFTMAAVRSGLNRDRYLGGKYDDIAVIVGYIY